MKNCLLWLTVGILALACLGLTVFMPWAELGMPAISGFESVHDALVRNLPDATAKTFNYAVYGVFLAFAMIAAAIAINIVGREDSEEKTVVPVKK